MTERAVTAAALAAIVAVATAAHLSHPAPVNIWTLILVLASLGLAALFTEGGARA